jgi:type II secretory pathway predicted ATPase ExeA
MAKRECNSLKQEANEYPFSADRPINSGSEDLLGRAKFATSLGKAIKSWKGKDSLVLALYGPWGSGKSSVKNLVLESLRASPSDCPAILEFSPWQLASQNQITEAFFSEIGIALGRADTPANASRLAGMFHAYGRYLSTGRFAFVGIKRFLVTVLTVIGLLGLSGLYFEWYLFLWLLAGGTTVMAAVLGYFSSLFDSISESFQAESKRKAKTISEMKDELRGMLTSLRPPLLVVLDDVDRLSGDELKLLFQLVKGNADFPNLIYILLLSLDHAQKSLEPMGGKEYMEKIVQIGFEMPRVERSQIHQLVGHEIEKVMSAHGSIDAFIHEIDRWRSIYALGAHAYFKTIRDVRRFASVLAFQLSHFSGGPILEINVVDLTTLQIIALFEPKLYQAIFSSKQQLVGAEPSSYGLVQPLGRGAASESVLDELAAHASDENRAYARKLLVELFPRLPFGKTNFSREDEQWASIIQSLRICHAGFFDRYFLLSIPQHDLSEVELHSIISASTDNDSFIKDILSVTQRGLFDILFERLEAHAGKLDMDRAVDILTALFDVGDMLPKIDTSFYIALPEERIAQLASAFISRELDADRQQQILIQGMRAASGIYVPLLTCTRLFHASARATSANFDAYLKQAQDECLKKIMRASEVGTLRSHKNLIHILRYWNGMGGPESGVRPWVSGLILDQEALIKFLREVSAEVISSDKGRFLRTNVESVMDFVSLEELEKRIEYCLGQPIRAQDKVLLNAWIEGLSYRKSASGQGGSGHEVEFKLVEE